MPSHADRLKFFVVNNHLTDGVSFNRESHWCQFVLSKFCCHHGYLTRRVWHTLKMMQLLGLAASPTLVVKMEICLYLYTRGNVEHCGASVSKRCTTVLTVM